MKKILIVMSAAAGLAFAGCRPQNPDVPAVREFIRDNWHTTVQHCTADTATLIGLPYPYTVPTAGAMFREMYYWDTFFTNEGLVWDGHPELAKGNTDNLLYMVRRFGKVYNGSRTYYEARSQTPYLSMMVDRIYRLTVDKQWLADAYETLKEEYGFWMRERLTPTGLNRYGSSASDALVDEFLVTGGKRLGTDLFDKGYTPERLHKLGLDFVAEAESGWDFNPRYDRRCTDFCPLDLNANLFMYEVNFARFAQELGRTDEIREWIAKAELQTRTPDMGVCVLSVCSGIFGSILTLWFVGGITCITQRKRIRASKKAMFFGWLLFPLFIFTYAIAMVYAVFTNIEWKPIQHKVALSVEDLNDTTKK